MYWFGKFLDTESKRWQRLCFRLSHMVRFKFGAIFFSRSVFFSAFSLLTRSLSCRFHSLHRILPAPDNVGRSIWIFEWGQIVTLSLKDGFLGMRAYRKQLLVVACLFIICQTFSGFFLFLFRCCLLFQLNIQTDDHHLECVCVYNIASATCRQDIFKFYQLLKIITLQVCWVLCVCVCAAHRRIR